LEAASVLFRCSYLGFWSWFLCVAGFANGKDSLQAGRSRRKLAMPATPQPEQFRLANSSACRHHRGWSGSPQRSTR
jgi:hypothetical protein